MNLDNCDEAAPLIKRRQEIQRGLAELDCFAPSAEFHTIYITGDSPLELTAGLLSGLLQEELVNIERQLKTL